MKQYLLILFIYSTIVSCSSEEKNTPATEENISDYKVKGDSIIAKTFDTLRNSLLAAVKEKGFDGAVEFCNTNAFALTNTFAVNTITIERTSDKLRNPANTPDSSEQRILSQIEKMDASSDKAAGIVERDASGNVHYYKPILMQAMCLNCHGTKEQIQPKTREVIQKKYPSDLAYGYKEGEFRGIWHVEFNRP
jgi:hypothetical protein